MWYLANLQPRLLTSTAFLRAYVVTSVSVATLRGKSSPSTSITAPKGKVSGSRSQGLEQQTSPERFVGNRQEDGCFCLGEKQQRTEQEALYRVLGLAEGGVSQGGLGVV